MHDVDASTIIFPEAADATCEAAACAVTPCLPGSSAASTRSPIAELSMFIESV